MDVALWQYAVAVIGGALAGFINTLAGNGSTITLTILTEVIGLSPNLANGTNRVGILAQSASSSYVFWKDDRLSVGRSRLLIGLTVIGALVGVWVAAHISNEAFRSVFRWLMVVMLAVVIVRPKRWLRDSDTQYRLPYLLLVPVALALGFYGGFIQMGMGIFFLAFMVLAARYDLTEANTVKIIVVGLYTVLVIAVFQWKGLIDWRVGGVMALGQMAGGFAAATFATRSPNANVWVHRLLVAVVILAVVKLFDLHLYFNN